VRLITNGTAGIALGASGDYTRGNTRRFTISDTFEGLLKSPKLPCDENYQTLNYAYPIAGKVGMGELIDTFIDLNEDKDLQAIDSGSPRVFGDTLKFTTILSGSASPHVEIAPVGNNWGLAAPTNIGALATRNDVHQIIIGLSMDAPKGKAPRARVARTSSFLAGGSTSAPAANNEERARDVVKQQKYDNFLDNAVILRR
jgi:hypothetical protein